MPTHADRHDLDKLKRWKRDLEAMPEDAPPVFAVFLVSAGDRVAHDIFRAFRDSFQERNLGFCHLVIFGQHGVSETAKRLQAELDLPEEALPALVFFGEDTGVNPGVVPLPAGTDNHARLVDGCDWHAALARVEAIADQSRAARPSEPTRALNQRLNGLCHVVVGSLEGC